MHLPPARSRVAFLQKGAWWGVDEGAILAWEEGIVGRQEVSEECGGPPPVAEVPNCTTRCRGHILIYCLHSSYHC